MATHRHILITASYESDKAIPSMEITRIVRNGLSDLDVEVEQIMSYTQSYRMSPMAAGLIEVWQNMSDAEREKVPSKLAHSIMVMMGVEGSIDAGVKA